MTPCKTSSKEFLNLLYLNFKVKLRNLRDYSQVISKYYSKAAFRNIDMQLLLSYLGDNPFLISQRFLIKKGEKDVYTYGETPLTTLEYVANQCRIKSSDVVIEMGCGRGRTCFWLNKFIGCSVIGVDFVPEFIERANNIKEKCQVTGVEFRLEDIIKTDLTGVTVVYIYGICYSDAFIEQLIDRLETLPYGAKVITVSYSLLEYKPTTPFEILKRFPARFTWGEADVYLQVKK